jgi:RNA-directed DNA polymerase
MPDDGGHANLGSCRVVTSTPSAKVNVKDHLAELGRIIKRGRALPQGLLIRQLDPKIRGWVSYYRTGVSQAAYHRLDYLTWIKLRSCARWRHPRKSIAGSRIVTGIG